MPSARSMPLGATKGGARYHRPSSVPTTLLALHGYTLNGARMRSQMGELVGALAPHVDLVFPDGPHTCDPASVDRMYEAWDVRRFPPPHLSWWDASDDGKVYRGWEQTEEAARSWVRGAPAVGLFGFSQGAMFAATLAALASAGSFPAVRFAVLVAGRKPRALALQTLFEAPIRVPSLHVVGDADRLTGSHGTALAEHFDAATREVHRWHGPHTIPTRGPAADAIVDFIVRHTR
jgi:predicted esterase